MIINHNMASLNTYRQMSTNMANTSKSLEKLSSGLRINKAGDDAAGLAISEKMRGQIRGLDQAARNGQDGISMLNTAEGALSETHSILQRMKELATQSANDTNTTSDRSEIQKEMNQLTSEVNRIGNTTEFNTQKLLNGGGVDPTKTASTAKILNIPANLAGGQAGTTLATSDFTIANLADVISGDVQGSKDYLNGKDIKITLGGKEVTLTLNSSLNAADSTATQIGIKDITDANTSAAAVRNALTAAVAADDTLTDQYAVSGATTHAILTAKTLSLTTNGELTGVDYSKGSITFNSTDSLINGAVTEAATKGVGTRATATIDFTGKTATDLVGKGLFIDGKKVDFFDSTNGEYKGDADFSVDLKGAGNAEAIVDKVVKTLHTGTASNISTVYATKTEDTKLQITAVASGIAGNSLALEDNFSRVVSNFKGSDKLTGEGVVSANGLKDGTQTVTVTYNAAKSTIAAGGTGAFVAADMVGVSIKSDTTLEDGTYRLLGTNANDNVQVQKLGDDGSWTTLTDPAYTLDLPGNTDFTLGDLTFDAGAGFDATTIADGDAVTFTIAKQHYSAALTEQDGTKGTEVTIKSNDVNVELKAQDGVGSVVINAGKIEDTLALGASTKFTFETANPTESKEAIVGGKFQATFQIGANTAQSMTVEVNDMRSQALKISGTTAGGSVTASNGSVATLKATKEVTNGTNNDSTEFALDVSTHEKATAAISVLDDAIQSVSAERSKIGAYTNRLDHTITNLGTSSENLTAAESRVRDVDMAKEMMQFQKNNILSQAAQAMMAQANQQPQGVLQLLR